ncbi:YlbL family protein [Winogradskya consettensis]|nr:S16 family serine protease [Actinoplanes consettensis]
MKRRGILLIAGVVVAALLAVGVLTFPLPYVVLQPGPTVDTLGSRDGKEVITVTGTPASVSAGQLRLTTIQVRSDISFSQAFSSWFNGDDAVAPRDVVYPPGQTTKEVQQVNTEAFQTSESSAVVVAKKKVGHPFEVAIDLDKIGGPSAGLMFTLGIIDKATPEDLTGGKIIAGTGTIDDAGTVGKIGGIPQKLVGAKHDGAQIFLVPEGNCDEALKNAVPGLPMAKVATIDDALTALKTFTSGGTPAPC